jgi:hypothetical protein
MTTQDVLTRRLPGAIGRRAGLLGLLVIVGLVSACRTSRPIAPTTGVATGDVLTGRMAQGRLEQSFVFEGVESSLLDFTLQADCGSDAAPRVEVLDPEGQALDVAAATTTTRGSATMRVQSLVLPTTGIYKVIARPSVTGTPVYYRFSHNIRFSQIPDRRTHLSAKKSSPVYVSAPRGGLIVFNIIPAPGSEMVPQIEAVKDPWGGPALDPAQVPKGALPPRVSHAQNGTLILTFTAPRPGMYTILAAAKPCRAGVGTLHAEVRVPKSCNRLIYHNNESAYAYGVPGTQGAAPSSALRPSVPPARVVAPPAPPPPSTAAGATRVTPPAGPVDPALASR